MQLRLPLHGMAAVLLLAAAICSTSSAEQPRSEAWQTWATKEPAGGSRPARELSQADPSSVDAVHLEGDAAELGRQRNFDASGGGMLPTGEAQPSALSGHCHLPALAC